MKMMKKQKYAMINDVRGATLPVALAFLGIFLVLTTAVLSYVQLEIQVSRRSVADGQAFAAAEAGIEYARWRLAHAPDDFTPQTNVYRDPQGGLVGTFELTIDPRSACNGSTRVVVKGRGADQKRTRTVAITYGAPALTKYSYLTNSNVWFGGGELKGPVHANGGIRMDADDKSRVTSAKQTYICGREHGCNPPKTKSGVWGTGAGEAKGLWDFPTGKIDFDTITLGLPAFRQQAVTANTYFGSSNAFGYHARMNENGTLDVFRVTEIKPKVWGYDGRTGWVETAEGIKSEVLVRTATIPEANACAEQSLFFFDDMLWVNGATKRPVTLMSSTSVIVNGSLTTPASGNEEKLGSIGIIAQNDVLIPLESADTLELHAAIFAQQGHLFRNYYCSDERLNKYGYKCNKSYAPYVVRSTISRKGTMISNQIPAFTWVNGSGQIISGYRGEEGTYDTRLIFTPPPFFPKQGENRILTWEEVN